jgi:hypothetical protein
MSKAACCPQVPVSWGELVDKITILRIKSERIAAREARQNVARELAMLSRVAGDAIDGPAVSLLIAQLRAVNEDLWEIEDSIRECEAEGDFGQRFVQLARSVYKKNDLRAAIKRHINDALGSELIEEKSYAGWATAPQPAVLAHNQAI